MNRDEFLKAFATLSPDDQEAVRAKLVEEKSSPAEEPTCGPALCHEFMGATKQKTHAQRDPTAMCKELLDSCPCCS